MLTSDYLTVRKSCVRPAEEWKAAGQGLTFLFPRQGCGEYVCGNRRERISVGDVLMFRAAEAGRVCGSEKGLVFLSFSLCLEHLYPLFAAKELPLLKHVLERLQTARRFPAATPVAAECHGLLSELPAETSLAQRSHLLRVATAVLAEELNHAEPKPGGFVRVDEHFTQVLDQLSSEELLTLSVGELAGRFGCSRRHLNRLFHEFLGLSAAALRQELRLIKAATLLRDPEAKVINVAGDCGFTHLGFFNTCFKRRFGSNPSEWRRLASRKEMARAVGSGGATARALQFTDPDRARREGNGDGMDLRFNPLLKTQLTKRDRQVPLAGLLVFLVGIALGFPCATEASESRMETPKLDLESQPYTFKSGDFRLLVTPSLELDYNDNVTLVKEGRVDDFILRPLLELDASYPISQRNLLRFNIGVGYDQYLKHDQYSAVRLVSGSEVAFDFYIKDFRFNIHDRFEYTQDPAVQASVAGTAYYGGLDNTAGLTGTWELRDIVLTLGYDHQNFVASSSQYDYLDRASELIAARAGFRVHPTVTAGLEGGASFTTYDQSYLNNNKGYSGGVFAQWKPNPYFRVEARVGYAGYLIDQTSRLIKAADQDAVYADLTVRHDLTKAVTYSVSAGHELRLGTSADLIDDYYVRPAVNWNIIRDLVFTMYLSYEHGKQGQSSETGALVETYDWLGTGLTLSHPILKHLTGSLNYRLTLRSSDVTSREYSQNLVGLRLTYEFK